LAIGLYTKDVSFRLYIHSYSHLVGLLSLSRSLSSDARQFDDDDNDDANLPDSGYVRNVGYRPLAYKLADLQGLHFYNKLWTCWLSLNSQF